MALLQRRNRRPEHFNWIRYWLPRGGTVDDNGGYLAEPGTERYLRKANTHLRTLDELDDVRCLLLLGDPSLGKSHEIEDYVARLTERQLDNARDTETFQIIAHDITEFDNRDQLRQAVFANEVVDGWRRGKGLLYIILDSLDETLIEFGPLCDFVLDQFATLPIDRCRVRLACRTSELPMDFRQALERQFRTLFGSAEGRAASDAVTEDDADDFDLLVPAITDALAEDYGTSAAAVPTPDAAGPDPVIRPFAAMELAVLTRSAVHLALTAAACARLSQDEFGSRPT
jgi:hypothetical protein